MKIRRLRLKWWHRNLNSLKKYLLIWSFLDRKNIYFKFILCTLVLCTYVRMSICLNILCESPHIVNSNSHHTVIRKSSDSNQSPKVRSSYGPLAYFSDIFISGKNENIGKICKWTITWTDFRPHTSLDVMQLHNWETTKTLCVPIILAGFSSTTRAQEDWRRGVYQPLEFCSVVI